MQMKKLLREKMAVWIETETQDMTPKEIAIELSAMAVILIGSMGRIAAKKNQLDKYFDTMIASIEEIRTIQKKNEK
jgi:CRISPR/Cas system CSM-associated protein Csm2 small subunit